MNKNKIKRQKLDECNICLNKRELSWDHVPPKGGITLSTVEIENIYKTLIGREFSRKIISQNGVKYRTLCGDCNSDLGSKYDATFNQFNRDVAIHLKSSLHLPPFTYLNTKPARLIRAIMGHLMAAKIEIDGTHFDRDVRNFLLSASDPLPSSINIFYWVYPYNCTIIMRDFTIPAIRGDYSTFMLCHVLKYFPIAFLIADKNKYHGLASLSDFRNHDLDEEVELRIDLKRVETFDWPERVDEENVLFASAETGRGVKALPR